MANSYSFCHQAIGLFTLALACDRLFAIRRPILYNKIGYKSIIVFFLVPTVISLVAILMNIFANNRRETPVRSLCITFEVLNDDIISYMIYLRIFCVGVACICYPFIHCEMTRRSNALVVTSRRDELVRRMRKTTISIGLMTVSAFCLLLLPDICYVLRVFPDELLRAIMKWMRFGNNIGSTQSS